MVGLVTRRVNERRAFGVKVLSLEGYVCKFFCVCMYVCMYIYIYIGIGYIGSLGSIG